jgi:hypothetical protein
MLSISAPTAVWLREGGRLKHDDIADQFQEIFLSGILSGKDPKGGPPDSPQAVVRNRSASPSANRERVTRRKRSSAGGKPLP